MYSASATWRRVGWIVALGLVALVAALGLSGQAWGGPAGSSAGGAAPRISPTSAHLGGPAPYYGVGNATVVAVAGLPPDPTNGGGCPNCNVTAEQYFWASIDGQGSHPVDG